MFSYTFHIVLFQEYLKFHESKIFFYFIFKFSDITSYILLIKTTNLQNTKKIVN